MSAKPQESPDELDDGRRDGDLHDRPLMTVPTTTLQHLLNEASLQQDDLYAELLMWGMSACECWRGESCVDWRDPHKTFNGRFRSSSVKPL